MTEAQLKHMVNRFLCWKLPPDFRPDCGVSFDAHYSNGMPMGGIHQPNGTNLFDATQATQMVRHMLEGLPLPSVTEAASPAPDNPLIGDTSQHGMNCPANREGWERRLPHDLDCRCGLYYRRCWQTAETMAAAWRKRVMEAEAASPAAGWRLVPIEPTEAITRAIAAEIKATVDKADIVWREALVVSPPTTERARGG